MSEPLENTVYQSLNEGYQAVALEVGKSLEQAQARIRELEAELAASQKQNHTQLEQRQFLSGLIDDMPISALRKENEELKARIAELELALVETIEDGTAGAESAIRRVEAAESDLKLLHQELDRLQRATGPQTCDVHASFSAGCLNCRLAQRDAQLAAAEERERGLREALESLWIEHPFDSDEPDTCAWCGDHYPSHDADCRIGDALSPVPKGETE